MKKKDLKKDSSESHRHVAYEFLIPQHNSKAMLQIIILAAILAVFAFGSWLIANYRFDTTPDLITIRHVRTNPSVLTLDSTDMSRLQARAGANQPRVTISAAQQKTISTARVSDTGSVIVVPFNDPKLSVRYAK